MMAAAVELFARRGFSATGIRDIARACDLSSSSLYEYMSTKEDLLVEIMATTIRPLTDAGRIARLSGHPPDWVLGSLTENHVWFHATHPHETMVTDSELRVLTGHRRERVVALRDEYEAVWRSVIVGGVQEGVFDVIDPDVTARSLISLCTGISGWYRPSGRLTIEQLCEAHADLALSAVRAQRNSRPIRRIGLTLPDPGRFMPVDRGAQPTVDIARRS